MSVLFNLIRHIFGGAFILSYKNPSTSHRRLSLQLLVDGGQQTSKQYKLFLLPLAAINRSRTRWLKTPHTLDRGLRGMQIVLTRTLLPGEQFSECEQERKAMKSLIQLRCLQNTATNGRYSEMYNTGTYYPGTYILLAN